MGRMRHGGHLRLLFSYYGRKFDEVNPPSCPYILRANQTTRPTMVTSSAVRS